MPKRKSPDKFSVGQWVILVLDESSKWERANGERAIVIGAKRYGTWPCSSLDGTQKGTDTGDRYHVRWRDGTTYVEEEQLRAIYDGEPVSTWAKFAKVTGLRLGKELVTIPIERKPSKRQANEARHVA